MEALWALIQGKAKAIAACHDFLAGDYAKTSEAAPVVATIQRIMADERDHLDAMKYLYDAAAKDKAATGMTDFAKQVLAEHRERSKLIK